MGLTFRAVWVFLSSVRAPLVGSEDSVGSSSSLISLTGLSNTNERLSDTLESDNVAVKAVFQVSLHLEEMIVCKGWGYFSCGFEESLDG